MLYDLWEKKTKVKINLDLKINDKNLDNEEVKFLGTTLDTKLTFDSKVDELKSTVIQDLV